MLERDVLIPATTTEVWEALTDPEALSDWFGELVEWDLAPGGLATFSGGEDGDREGRVEEVVPEEHLRFRWWPVGDEAGASEVTYRLVPEEAGTRLVVTEGRAAPPVASGAVLGRTDSWSAWDTRLVGMWLRAAPPTARGTVGSRVPHLLVQALAA